MSIFQTETTVEGTAKAEDLVGEGKKYKDYDALAASKLEADRTIKTREEELRGIREDLARQAQIIEAYKKLEGNVQPPTPGEPPAPKSATSEVDLDARVEALLKKREAQSTAQANIETVTKKMTEIYGTVDKAAEVVSQKAQELGMSPQALGKIAAENPKVYFRLIGVDGDKKETPVQSSSWGGRNTQAVREAQQANGSVVQPGTYKWYQELRKNDPSTFWSPRVQLQLDKDAREAAQKGRDFYS